MLFKILKNKVDKFLYFINYGIETFSSLIILFKNLVKIIILIIFEVYFLKRN